MNVRNLLILGASLSFIACGDANTDKGAEENPLTGGKGDSFYRPTEHGTLQMDINNRASLNEEEQFHAWTFELSGDATVDIKTEISPNLDTVMYLYHRDSPDDSWGRFKRKNDDHNDSVASRITHEATAGHWRVIVKGYKKTLRGAFSVVATCEGDGCNAPSSGECGVDQFKSLPRPTPYDEQCTYDIAGIFTSEVVSNGGGAVTLAEKCSLMGVERDAIDFYHEYWEEIIGDFEDYFDYGDEIELNYSVTAYRTGTEVTVDAGGDEDGLSMLFDQDGKLLAAYQHNQSPTVDYYCGTGGEEAEAPHEDCYSDLRNALQRSDESERQFGEISMDDPSGRPEGVIAVAAVFYEQAGISHDIPVEYELITFTTSWDDAGVAVNLIGPDEVSAEYTAFQEYNDEWNIVMVTDANGSTFVCE